MAQNPPYLAGEFFQANTAKGYEAWDKAGAVANELSGRFRSIPSGPAGLVCESPLDPKDYLQQVRVDAQHISLSFRPGTQVGTSRRDTARLVEWVAQTINVAMFSRLGLRTFVVWGRDSLEQAGAEIRDRFLPVHLQDWGSVGDVQAAELVLTVAADDLRARVVLQPIQRKTPVGTEISGGVGADDADAPPFGILLDVDIVKNGSIYYTDLQSYFRHCADLLNERILPHVERQLRGAGP
jgi:hypothetical protein